MVGGITLKDSTFALYAAKAYDNVNCDSEEEFQEDLKRFKYVKRLFNAYVAGGELKHRLILNHIIIIYNVFESQAATNMLFLKMRGLEKYLKPFLVLLGRMPDRIEIGGAIIHASDVAMDQVIVDALRKI